MTRDEAVVTAINASAAHQFVLSKKDFYASLAASGYAVVPVRPTDEMLTIGAEWVGDAFKTIRAYRAMLAAAQEDSHE